MSFCPNCGTKTGRFNRCRRGAYKNWCTTCIKKVFNEKRYEKHPEKRPPEPTAEEVLRQQVIDEMTPAERRKVAGDNLFAIGAGLTPILNLTGYGRKGLKENEAEIKRRIEAKKNTAHIDELTDAIERTYHKR